MKNILSTIVFVSIIVSQTVMASEECTLYLDRPNGHVRLEDYALIESAAARVAQSRGYRIVQDPDQAEFVLDVRINQMMDGCGRESRMNQFIDRFFSGDFIVKFSGRIPDGTYVENSETNDVHLTFRAFKRMNLRHSLRRVIPYCSSQN